MKRKKLLVLVMAAVMGVNLLAGYSAVMDVHAAPDKSMATPKVGVTPSQVLSPQPAVKPMVERIPGAILDIRAVFGEEIGEAFEGDISIAIKSYEYDLGEGGTVKQEGKGLFYMTMGKPCVLPIWNPMKGEITKGALAVGLDSEGRFIFEGRYLYTGRYDILIVNREGEWIEIKAEMLFDNAGRLVGMSMVASTIPGVQMIDFPFVSALPKPSRKPSPGPTINLKPSANPQIVPSEEPTPAKTSVPSATQTPSTTPAPLATQEPSAPPTPTATQEPVVPPSVAPTESPTVVPTTVGTAVPLS